MDINLLTQILQLSTGREMLLRRLWALLKEFWTYTLYSYTHTP